MPATSTDVVQIPFQGTQLHSALIDGTPYVVLRPAVEAMGLNYSAQFKKLQTKSWATISQIETVGADGKVRPMTSVDLDTWVMLMANINEDKVAPQVKATVIAFQRESAKALRLYWATGAAVNPRVDEQQLPTVVGNAVTEYRSDRERLIAETRAESLAWAEVAAARIPLVEAMVRAGAIAEVEGLNKIRVIGARGLGEDPQIPEEDTPIYVEDYLKGKGCPPRAVRNFSGAFGIKIMTEAAVRGIEPPGKRQVELSDGAIRQVNAWTKKDLWLFDAAWARSYAKDRRLMAA